MDMLDGGCGFSPDYDDAPFRVVVAFDSFKGSLTAHDACAIASDAIRSAFGPAVSVTSFPMADGGEGSLDLIARSTAMQEVTVSTVDAIGRPIEASYLVSADGCEAHIELARACGLPQVSDVPLQPLKASTLGVGQVVAHALSAGASRIVLYAGGSASTDAGSGLLAALGARFLNAAGEDLEPGGGALAELKTLDTTHLLPTARAATWIVVTDVEAPLTGPSGAAHVFAPQKGADPEQVAFLDEALIMAAAVTTTLSGREVGTRPGSGAAGGFAALLDAIIGVDFVPGSIYFADFTGLTWALPLADLVLTGEGRLDSQSLTGKVVGAVTALASAVAPTAPPVVAVAGSVDRRSLGRHSGLRAAFSLAEGPADLSSLIDQAARLLADRCVDIVALSRESFTQI